MTETLVSGRVLVFPPLQELEELLGPSFFEKTHKRALYSLHLGAWDLGDPPIAVHKATCDLFEFQIPGDVSVDENFRKLARGNDKFGDEIDGVVTVSAKLSRRGLVRSKFAVQLQAERKPLTTLVPLQTTHLGQIETRTVTTVVIIAIHVENFLPLDREQT